MARTLVSGPRPGNHGFGRVLTTLPPGGRVPGMAKNDRSPMVEALAEAETAAVAGEVPVGAVLVDWASGEVLARAHNRVEELRDPTAHAELLAIQEVARRLGSKRLTGVDLYVTLEP